MGCKWLDYLRENQDAVADFLAHLDERQAGYQRQQDAATSWEGAKEALGAKKSLDALKSYVKVSIQEDQAHVAHAKSVRVRSA